MSQIKTESWRGGSRCTEIKCYVNIQRIITGCIHTGIHTDERHLFFFTTSETNSQMLDLAFEKQNLLTVTLM
jgi:hypothetical protein